MVTIYTSCGGSTNSRQKFTIEADHAIIVCRAHSTTWQQHPASLPPPRRVHKCDITLAPSVREILMSQCASSQTWLNGPRHRLSNEAYAGTSNLRSPARRHKDTSPLQNIPFIGAFASLYGLAHSSYSSRNVQIPRQYCILRSSYPRQLVKYTQRFSRRRQCRDSKQP